MLNLRNLAGLLLLNTSVALGALLPDLDPFYRPPAGYESKAPGAVLRSRLIVPSFSGVVIAPVEAHQLLYRTSAIDGSAISTVTTIFKPLAGAKTDRFISFQTAYDSAATRCDPSYTYQLGSLVTSDLITEVEEFLIQAYLLSGYIVVSSDYEGPEAAFGAGRLAGMGVLDSMRAVINYGGPLGLTAQNPMIVGTGYSGGSIATGWAASLQPKYAPELNIKGWSMGGTPANLTGTAYYVDGTVFAGFLPPALVGLSRTSTYGSSIQSVFSQDITTAGNAALDFASKNCGPDDVIALAFKSILSTNFQKLGSSFFSQPQIAAVLAKQTMGVNPDETPKPPVYMYHAPGDEIIPYNDAHTTFNAWCADGASVTFNTVKDGGHATTEIVGFPQSFKFVTGAFSATPTSGCNEITSTEDLEPLALGLNLEPITVKLINALNIAGHQDINIKNDPSTLKKTT
ncbi:LIP-domain-containing protein [Piedraia hortae CBS 480.64]|uniref:LIP-domain-containing protein n=1 Tax=Piedraia hortae CBS 480.64 TaxID=1314780 RepID=A0A6A7BR57_9PEZI|nr:LIP-domain-containing protein [Piedraia hortae CBS 480.64]